MGAVTKTVSHKQINRLTEGVFYGGGGSDQNSRVFKIQKHGRLEERRGRRGPGLRIRRSRQENLVKTFVVNVSDNASCFLPWHLQRKLVKLCL